MLQRALALALLRQVTMGMDLSLKQSCPPPHTEKIKVGESLENRDHMLDMVGPGFQLVVNVAHAPRPLSADNDSAVFQWPVWELWTTNGLSVPTICLVTRLPETVLRALMN